MTAVDLEAETPAAPVGALWRWIRSPLRTYASILVVLAAVVWSSAHLLERYTSAAPQQGFPGDAALGGWFQYDGGWYRFIAENGYHYLGPDQQSPVAFFPVYPMLMRALGWVTGNVVVAGVIITVVCGAAAAVLLHRWTSRMLGDDVAAMAVVVLLLYPFAFYLFGAVYSDALFVVAVFGAFLLLERDEPVLAGLAGAVATATRPTGVAVIVGLAAVWIHRRGGFGAWRTWRARDAGVLLSCSGLAAWCGYLWVRFGDPLAFATVQQAPGWDQGSGPSTWFKVTLLQRVHRLPGYLGDVFGHTTTYDPRPWTQTTYTLGIVLQGLLVLGALVLVPLVWRRLGWGYAVYALALLALPLIGTKDFQGAGRYLLAAFPCIAVFAELLLRHRMARLVWLPVSAALLLLLSSGYARAYYVG